ncbi:Protein of unknown function [Mesonia phycicola]|uniref:DUF2490 domain-containing protein n=1 Tax=Mesonia phycicola TaxID=579105 RepID=A0A1M6HFY5_9FLAO|nr:DUF2490 domain-containing protein [Mesonia phycicola]SHJ21122.1 Protein of unknown function [Mesonia phycicola]
MIISFSKYILFIFLFLITFTSSSQDFTALINPAVSVTIKNETPWSYTFGTAYRSNIYQHTAEENLDNKKLKINSQFTEFNHSTTRKIGFNSKLSAGIKYRFVETYTGKKDETRFIEQYAYTKKYEKFKLVHRVRFVQRFRERTTLRGRYRLLAELPLNGNRVDAKELSLVGTIEGVWEFGKEEVPNYGFRYSNYLGYRITNNTVLNLGVEYRYRNFTKDAYTQLFLISALKISI